MFLPEEDPDALKPGIKKIEVLPDKRARVTIWPYHQNPNKPTFIELTTLMSADDIRSNMDFGDFELSALKKIVGHCIKRIEAIEAEKREC